VLRPAVIAFAIALAALIGLSAQAASVQAHALLIRSDPEADARLGQAPERVTAWFSEPLESGVSRLRVLAGEGEPVDLDNVEFDQADATEMSVGVTEVGPGFYLVTWETLSRVDGHFRFGSFEFVVLNPDGSEPTGARPVATFDVTGRPTGIAEGALTKALGIVAAVIVVGGLGAVIFAILPSSRTLRDEPRAKLREGSLRFLVWVILPAIVVLLLVGLAELAIQARQFGGLEEVDQVLDTRWGERWLWRHGILVVLLVGLLIDVSLRTRGAVASTLSLWPFLAAGVIYLFLVSLASHANAVPAGSFWATASDFIHLGTAGIWIGGLVTLAALLLWSRRAIDRDQRPELLATALQRFSLMAATSLTLLLATGIFNALVEVPAWSALTDTAYGRALTIKLVVILPLLAVAGLNAFFLRPNLVRKAGEDADGVERLRRLLAGWVPLEAALGIAVLAVVGVLTQYTPARIEIEAAVQPAAAAATASPDRDSFDFPLASGDWSWVAAGLLLVAGILFWIWSGYLGPALGILRRGARIIAAGLAIIAGVVILDDLTTSEPPAAFEAAVALRYQVSDGRLVLLEIDPFQVGANRFKATVMTEKEETVEAESVQLRFSRLEVDSAPADIPATRGGGEQPSYFAEFSLQQTGWWAIEAVLDGQASTLFYLRLDQPSRAPLEFAGADYQSDPAAEQLFRQTLERYEGLHSLQWREQLTSGLLNPTGIGAWVVTDGASEAPDKVRYDVFSPGNSDYTSIRVGEQSCSQDKGEPWQCSTRESTETFDLDYLEPATAFRLGRKESIDGETTQAILFNNPSQAGAWYTWWVSEGTGHLLRQAMVAPGHFMLTRFFGHDQSVAIQLPPEAGSPGG
jgi:copper transport protein